MARRWFFGWQAVVAFFLYMIFLTTQVTSQPQTNLLLRSCSLQNTRSSFRSLNETFREVRRLLSNNNTYFATSEKTRSSEPVYMMAQCRLYMSTVDCLACYDVATSNTRACGAASGARAVLDGCFLRYDPTRFYEDATQPGNVAYCGNHTATKPTRFQTTVNGLLSNLTIATHKINDLFVASSSNIHGSNRSVYAIAQCAPTVAQNGCKVCLKVAYFNIMSCLPFVDGRALDTGCFMRYSNKPFFRKNETTNIESYLVEDSSKKRAIIGGVVGSLGLLSMILLAILLWCCRSKKRSTPRGKSFGRSDQLQDPFKYSYSDLKKATKNFCNDYKLGEGGYGEVYKGNINLGNTVAVKKLLVSSAKEDFESEVRVLTNVHHRNLIRLLGCCNEGPELLLVLEYMENGSLEKFLYGERKGILNWKQRRDIILGIAKGLAYLHEQYHVTIIHRDINPRNILLDNDFQPKIADFGLARLLPEDQTHISTRVAGTFGYTAPEYAIHGQLSEKSDTYSFGIVVLEIVSGKRCTDVLDVSHQYLLEHARNMYENRIPLNLIDEELDQSEYTEQDVQKIIEIALLCTRSTVSERPTMSEVLILLNDRSGDHRPPTRLPFNVLNFNVHIDDPSYVASSITNAVASMTELTAR
ncbi:unnamed protein product [Lactuca saligna]|uniref:Cysteine-rich receptor-like protein kinase n=1 Tax=Lactuca saligna TaxID=75948 RepID=A0AA35YLY1_LACSI|nr:unnamed protein product [Lactuca saligna]